MGRRRASTHDAHPATVTDVEDEPMHQPHNDQLREPAVPVVDLTWRSPERAEPDELDRLITDATQP